MSSPKRAVAARRLMPPLFFMQIRDISLFLQSARTDKKIARLRSKLGARAAFEAVYGELGDPWASADPRFLYQRYKYEVLGTFLPPRSFARALELGAGLGGFSKVLAGRANEVIGIDVSARAVELATSLHKEIPNLRFQQGDLMDLPTGLDGCFDLVTVADTIYYLPPPLDDALLKEVVLRVARLLRPGGIVLIANHFFASVDRSSRVSRRIHHAFAWSPSLQLISDHRRPFYLASVLESTATGLPSPRILDEPAFQSRREPVASVALRQLGQPTPS